VTVKAACKARKPQKPQSKAARRLQPFRLRDSIHDPPAQARDGRFLRHGEIAVEVTLRDRTNLAGSLPAPTRARRAIRARLETCDQQQIDDFDGLIGQADANGAARRRLAHKLRMFDGERPAVGKMDVKWLKWLGVEHPSQLFDGHDDIVKAASLPRQVCLSGHS
jgi:hypothetical protein